MAQSYDKHKKYDEALKYISLTIKSTPTFLRRRDETIDYSLKKVDPERRTGYAWYGGCVIFASL